MNNPPETAQTNEPCSHSRSCKLFPILRASQALEYWTRIYCNGDHRRCARYVRMAEGLSVSPNLLPNGKKI